jgi:uncharacterized protein YdbL (DUF1318 family)
MLALLAILFVAAPVMAQAKPLDAPRAAGIIGERYDGYVVLRKSNASQSIKNLVARTNAERRALYEKRAKQEKVPVQAIGKIYAKQIFQSAPKGTYFLQANGKWTRR